MQIDGSKVDKKSYIQLQISLVTIFQGKVLAQSLYIKYQILTAKGPILPHLLKIGPYLSQNGIKWPREPNKATFVPGLKP